MLAEYVAVNVCRAYLVGLGDAGAEAGRVKQSSGSENAVGRNAACLYELVSQNVNRVGDNYIKGVGASLCYQRNDALCDVHVGLGKVKARLAGLSSHAGSEDYDVGIFRVLVVAVANRNRAYKRRGLADVHGLAHRLFLDDVNDDDF